MTMSQLASKTFENFKVLFQQRWYGIELDCPVNQEMAEWCYDTFGDMYGYLGPLQFRMNERWYFEQVFGFRIFIKEETDVSMFILRFGGKIFDLHQLSGKSFQ